jgi:hypothetical protein
MPPLSDGLRVIITVLDEYSEEDMQMSKRDVAFASEKSLAKDWLSPEEDEAWAHL